MAPFTLHIKSAKPIARTRVGPECGVLGGGHAAWVEELLASLGDSTSRSCGSKDRIQGGGVLPHCVARAASM